MSKYVDDAAVTFNLKKEKKGHSIVFFHLLFYCFTILGTYFFLLLFCRHGSYDDTHRENYINNRSQRKDKCQI